MLGEIGRCTDDSHAQVRTDAHRDHVLRHLLAQSDARVVAFRDDIGQAVIDDDLDMDVRIFAHQLRDRGPEDRFRRMLAGRDANVSGRLLAKLAQPGQFGIDLVKPGSDGMKQPFARLGWRNIARRAREQPDTQPLFEAAYRVTEGRCRNAKLRRRVRETALACHGDEGGQVVEVFSCHL